ncbi:MAG: glycosyltransferase family 4 protein [Chloroflexi bacterium]|nr:glycosyltransferase family 4 protein [Chloroflexota bacterium]
MAYRILAIAPTSFFADYGCHVRILEEVWALQKLGNKVVVCTYHTGDDVPGLDIRRSLDVPWKKGVQVGSSRHKLYFDVMLASRAARTVLSFKPDVIHAHIHEGALIGRAVSWLRRVPVVFDLQGSLAEEMIDHRFLRRDSRMYGPVRWLESRINLSSDRIITSTHNAAVMARGDFHVPTDRVRTIPDCVNVERFSLPRDEETKARIAGLKRWLEIPESRKVVVYLGLLAPYQGTDVLLESARLLLQRMPDVHFLVMGFPGVDRYRYLAEQLGIAESVTLPGRIPYLDAPIYLALGDVAVAPKMSVSEGCGKISNYMAMQLPVVAFDTPVAREIMGDDGTYAEMGNPASLASAIEALLQDGERASQLGYALRRRAVNSLSWEGAAKQIMAVYAEALGKRSA